LVAAPTALSVPRRLVPSGDHSKATFAKAWVALGLGALVLSACGSTAAPSTRALESSAIEATVAPPVVASGRPSAVASVPATMAVTSSVTPEAAITVPKVGWLAFDGTTLWIFTGSGQTAGLDPATNAVGGLTDVDTTHQGGGFAVNKRGLWLNDFDANLVYRVDPVSLKVVAKIEVGPNPEGLAVDPKDGAIWVANHRGGTVARIDPATNKVVATIAVGNPGSSGPHQLGLGLGSVWVGVPNTSSVYRIDPMTNGVVATITIPAGASLAAASHSASRPSGRQAARTPRPWSASIPSRTRSSRRSSLVATATIPS